LLTQVVAKRLDIAADVLRHLRRLCLRASGHLKPALAASFNAILDSVQARVRSNYSGSMAIDAL
jgi:hypothetical protein